HINPSTLSSEPSATKSAAEAGSASGPLPVRQSKVHRLKNLQFDLSEIAWRPTWSRRWEFNRETHETHEKKSAYSAWSAVKKSVLQTQRALAAERSASFRAKAD